MHTNFLLNFNVLKIKIILFYVWSILANLTWLQHLKYHIAPYYQRQLAQDKNYFFYFNSAGP